MKRGDLGKMEWSDGSRLEEFEQNLAKHLDIEIDRGDCIQQNIDMTWSQEDCNKRLQFVCSLKPLMTINEKISKDFEKLSFNSQKSSLSNELTDFNTIENVNVPENTENNSSENVKTDSMLKERTTETPKMESNKTSLNPLGKDILMQPNMSNFLIPFGGGGQ
uniref:C-type lectin domain-containing protein n=1 Tax=Panagrolaimus davidi TaxID=227884 RepID=A0A914P5M2_9BILA